MFINSARTVIFILNIVVGVFSGAFAHAEEQLTATALRFSGTAIAARIEIDFDGDPQIVPRLLAAPNRLVLDLPETFFAIGNVQPPKNNLISSFRSGLMQEGRSRVVIAVNSPFSFVVMESGNATQNGKVTYAITLSKVTDAAFAKSIDDQILSTASTTSDKGDRVVVGASSQSKPFTIVIDAGHGGIDGGAQGIHGTIEKEVTLSFALELAESLRSDRSLKVFSTREDDRFIALDERVKIARQLNADVFISIHADTIADKSLRGATVYTLSDKASDQVAQAVAAQENLADAIGGVDVKVEDQAVADILIDLTRRETMQYSVSFARATVEALQHKTKLINNAHRSAGFRVLRAPDIPSILVELGYLSNVEDEKLIKDPLWRKGIVAELSQAIKSHAATWVAARQ